MFLKKDRGRSLNLIDEIFESCRRPESVLSDLLKLRTPCSVLEVGFGWGHALLELAWKFRDKKVAFHGIDALQKFPMEKQEDLKVISEEFDIIPSSEIPSFDFPKIYFYDATNLQFEDESMDFIYSAVTIRFIKEKARFLEEACRVLKPGGVALLHFGESKWNYPYSRISDDRMLTPYMNRFVLKYGVELIPLPTYFRLFEDDCFRFQFTSNLSRCIITVSKLKSGHLDLDLDYNEALTISGRKLPLVNKKGEVRGGIRSVYDVRPERYQELFQKGFLSHDQLRKEVHLSDDL